jgi:hypothetical protein
MFLYRLECLLSTTLLRGGTEHPGDAVGDAGQEAAATAAPQGGVLQFQTRVESACFRHLHGGQGDSLVPSDTRGSFSLVSALETKTR